MGVNEEKVRAFCPPVIKPVVKRKKRKGKKLGRQKNR
jgi:hypothetical protein